MKILITGFDGFIGTLVRKKIGAEKWQVIEFLGDLTRPDDLKKFFYEGCGYDRVIHLAGLSAIPDCELAPDKAYLVNSVGTFLLVDKMKQFCPLAQLIFASSGQVYKPPTNLADRHVISEDSPIEPVNIYAKTKRIAELFLEDVWGSSGGRFVILRIFNHSHKSQRPDFLMPSVYQQIREKKKLGQNKVALEVGNVDLFRDIGAVQDLVEAFHQVLLSSKDICGVFNLCSGHGKNLKKLIFEMGRVLNIDLELVVMSERVRKNDLNYHVGSSQKFAKTFSWKPKGATDENTLVESFLAEIS